MEKPDGSLHRFADTHQAWAGYYPADFWICSTTISPICVVLMPLRASVDGIFPLESKYATLSSMRFAAAF